MSRSSRHRRDARMNAASRGSRCSPSPWRRSPRCPAACRATGATGAGCGTGAAVHRGSRRGRARRFPGVVRSARPRVGHAGALPGRLRHLLDHGRHRVARVERRCASRACRSTSPRTTSPTTCPRVSTSRAWRRASSPRRTTPAGRVRCSRVATRTRARAAPRSTCARCGTCRTCCSCRSARPAPTDNAAVKWAVSTYGGVDAAIDFDAQGRVPVLEREHERVLQRQARESSTTTSSAWAGTTASRPAASPRDRRRRRLPHQEQLGHGLRARPATSGSPTTT